MTQAQAKEGKEGAGEGRDGGGEGRRKGPKVLANKPLARQEEEEEEVERGPGEGNSARGGSEPVPPRRLGAIGFSAEAIRPWLPVRIVPFIH